MPTVAAPASSHAPDCSLAANTIGEVDDTSALNSVASANSGPWLRPEDFDLSKSKEFYGRLFNWMQEDVDVIERYTHVTTGSQETAAGMRERPLPEVPAGWLPYVEVADVKRTLAKAKKLGATIIVDYQPVPGVGSLGILADPTGVAIGVFARPKARRRR